MINEDIEDRIDELVKEGEYYKDKIIGGTDTPLVDPESYGWLTSSANLVSYLAGNNELYCFQTRRIIDTDFLAEGVPYKCISKMLGLLIQLRKDYKKDLLSNIEYFYAAENFGDFLDQARECSSKNGEDQKNVAGLLVSAVFQNTLKKIAKKNSIDTSLKNDEIISELVRKQIINRPFSAQIRSAAALRNQAFHAEWEGFTNEDVKNSITTVGNLIERYL